MQLDRDFSNEQPRSIPDFVDTLIERQAKIDDAAIQSQTSINTANLRKRYQTYSRAPKLRQRLETSKDDHTGTTDPVSIADIIAIKRTPKPPYSRNEIGSITEPNIRGLGVYLTL